MQAPSPTPIERSTICGTLDLQVRVPCSSNNTFPSLRAPFLSQLVSFVKEDPACGSVAAGCGVEELVPEPRQKQSQKPQIISRILSKQEPLPSCCTERPFLAKACAQSCMNSPSVASNRYHSTRHLTKGIVHFPRSMPVNCLNPDWQVHEE